MHGGLVFVLDTVSLDKLLYSFCYEFTKKKKKNIQVRAEKNDNKLICIKI